MLTGLAAQAMQTTVSIRTFFCAHHGWAARPFETVVGPWRLLSARPKASPNSRYPSQACSMATHPPVWRLEVAHVLLLRLHASANTSTPLPSLPSALYLEPSVLAIFYPLHTRAPKDTRTRCPPPHFSTAFVSTPSCWLAWLCSS